MNYISLSLPLILVNQKRQRIKPYIRKASEYLRGLSLGQIKVVLRIKKNMLRPVQIETRVQRQVYILPEMGSER